MKLFAMIGAASAAAVCFGAEETDEALNERVTEAGFEIAWLPDISDLDTRVD